MQNKQTDKQQPKKPQTPQKTKKRPHYFGLLWAGVSGPSGSISRGRQVHWEPRTLGETGLLGPVRKCFLVSWFPLPKETRWPKQGKQNAFYSSKFTMSGHLRGNGTAKRLTSKNTICFYVSYVYTATDTESDTCSLMIWKVSNYGIFGLSRVSSVKTNSKAVQHKFSPLQFCKIFKAECVGRSPCE